MKEGDYMDLSIINNISDIPAIHNFTKSQEQEEWMNRNTWFGSLDKAQEKANEYMAANKERIPMVIEYLSGPGSDADSSNRVSVTMYINPNRLVFSQQKIKSKAVTRGGIFYNHWGDDNPQMQLAGSVGLSGMSGIKKIDQIYKMSGVLLSYNENNAGPVYVGGTTDLYNSIAKGDYTGAVRAILGGDVKSLGKTIMKDTKMGAATAITGKVNTALRSSSVYQKTTEYLGAGVEKINNALNQYGNISIGCDMPKDEINETTSALGMLGGSVLGGMIRRGLGLTSDDDMSRQVVDFDTASAGFQDINDELEDPWRPRLVWIYFEDHVWIGHFDSFSYQRVAETPNINYELKFTVQREIIVTSYNPKLPGFVPAQQLTAPIDNDEGLAKTTTVTGYKSITQRLTDYSDKSAESVKHATLDILNTKETFSYEKNVALDNDSSISAARTTQLWQLTAQLRAVAGIPDSDDLLGNNELSNDQRLVFYAYANPNHPGGPDANATRAVDNEMKRIKAKADKLRKSGLLTEDTKNSMWSWLEKIHNTTGNNNYADWEKQLIPA